MPSPSQASSWFLNGRVTIALARADNADGLSIIQHEMRSGDAPPDHVHHGEDEVFHILDGELTLQIDGAAVVARAGDTVLAPRSIPHGFTVTSPGVARFLTITRGGFEDVVRSFSRTAETDDLPPVAAPSPEMQAALAAACAAGGITLLGPAPR
jgi:quercetin dioxygenase-like cupin family protein